MNIQAKSSEVITKEEIREILIDFICKQFIVEIEDIRIDKSLVDTGIIDSMGLIEIAYFIEKKFNFKVKEDQMNRKNFGSIQHIVDFINDNKK